MRLVAWAALSRIRVNSAPWALCDRSSNSSPLLIAPTGLIKSWQMRETMSPESFAVV